MAAEYDLYCTVDPYYYDLPRAESSSDAGGSFAVTADGGAPDGWVRVDEAHWVHFAPRGAKVPPQGWKVHVSAHMGNLERVVGWVWDYCVREAVPFKLTPSPRKFRDKNIKYAPRVASGKLFTIYPDGEVQLHKVLSELGNLLKGEEGPYVLSDVRWEDGPLYVRYGAFAKRISGDENGNGRICIENPRGELEPDPRGVVFTVPDWVSVPDFLQPHIDRHLSPVIDEFPYAVEDALHFSNGGGVYRGVERATGRRVLLKEARPHAGLDGHGSDAVTRLRRERDMLVRLSSVAQVPDFVDYRKVGDHEFLIQEYIEGNALYSEGAKRNPLSRQLHPPAEELRLYTEWALGVWHEVRSAVEAVHAAGVVFGDLHPNNVLVTDVGQVVLIDWEAAFPEKDDMPPPMGNPGFMAPSNLSGFAIDEYALALMKIALFAPVTSLVRLSTEKIRHVAELVRDAYDLAGDDLEGDNFADEVKAVTGGRVPNTSAGPEGRHPDMAAKDGSWSLLCDEIGAGILADATPEREDRLFPGDIAQFTSPYGGLGFAHGAAGVLWTLHATRGIRFPEGERWLRDRGMAVRSGAPRGFYDGDHGVAHALWALGYGDEAVELLERTYAKGEERISVDLEKGLAGIGLNWLHFHTEVGDDAYLQRAVGVAEALSERVLKDPDHVDWSSDSSPGGAIRGPSGPALFFVRLYEVTGEQTYLEVAAEALHRDLDKCAFDDHGSLLLKDGFRVLPYLSLGSAGTGMVLRRYLEHVPDEDLRVKCTAIAKAVNTGFCVFPGLFDGRAGLILTATSLAEGEGQEYRAWIEEQVNGLNWHVLSKDGRRVFPGNHLLRLSCDLATGSAGVLLALQRANHAANASGACVGLPFFSSGSAATSQSA